jgi:hypothetical protein
MPSYSLLDLSQVIRSWGRGVVFRAPKWSPGDGPLSLTHLGDTEGDINIATNGETAGLTVPELTGPAVHEFDYTGENPVIEIPLYLTDPTLLALVSPSGSAQAGRSRRSAPVEHTLAIFPEPLFLVTDPTTGIVTSGTLELSGGSWTLDSVALDAAQLTFLDMSFWLWRAVFTRPPRKFHGGAGDARKNIETVSAQGMHHPDMPEGMHLYTMGDPTALGIDIEFGS